MEAQVARAAPRRVVELTIPQVPIWSIFAQTRPRQVLGPYRRTYKPTGHLRVRGISLMRNSATLGPYSRTMPRALPWSLGVGPFL